MLVSVNQLPEERKNSIRVFCNVLEITDSNGTAHPCKGKIQLYFQKPAEIACGDKILILSSPDLPSGADNPHQLDYRRLLKRRGILYTDYIPSGCFRIVGHSDKGLKAKTTTLRRRILNVIRFSSLSPSQQGIAEALILGYSGDLEQETQSQFRSAGITHLLCVSGLHVGIVSLLVGYSLFFLSGRRRSRIIKGTIQLLAIWGFVIISGMAPSAMRAGLMFSLIVIGQMFFTRPYTLNAVAASALILLVAKPLLLFEIGFQLSYTAVIAIATLVRPLESLMPLPDGNSRTASLLFNLLKKIRSLFCVCIVAQLAITPLTLYYFHQFPPYFLVANMTIVPFAALLLGSVLLMVLFAWWPLAFKAMGTVVSTFLAGVEWTTSTIASWPNAMIKDIYFDTPMFVLSLFIVIFSGWTLLHKKWSTASLALATAILLIIYSHRVEASCAVQRHCDIYRVGNRTAIEFFAGHQSYLLCDSSTATDPSCIDFQISNNRIFRQTRHTTVIPLNSSFQDSNIIVENRFVGFDGRLMRIIDRSNYRQHSASRTRLDYLLLHESPYITVGELLDEYQFDTLIIASQNSVRRRQAWQQQCDSLGVPYK